MTYHFKAGRDKTVFIIDRRGERIAVMECRNEARRLRLASRICDLLNESESAKRPRWPGKRVYFNPNELTDGPMPLCKKCGTRHLTSKCS